MNDRENDNRIKDEGRQVQQELEDQLRAFGDTMTDAFGAAPDIAIHAIIPEVEAGAGGGIRPLGVNHELV